MPPADPTIEVPVWVRAAFGHAVVQYLADEVGADVLHLKGAATDLDLRTRPEGGSDADVLVRPAHMSSLLEAMSAHGWSRYSVFETGSPFEHATTVRHPDFVYADLHRIVPGFDAEPDAAFESLWRRRERRQVAGCPCWVPDRVGQVLVRVFNETRSGAGRRWTREEIEALLSSDHDLLTLVEALDAHVAMGAALGELERYRGRRTYRLWKTQVEDATRVQEWLARMRAAGTVRGALRVALRAPLVNVDRLSHKLGHEPSRAEVAREFVARPARGVREEWAKWRSR